MVAERAKEEKIKYYQGIANEYNFILLEDCFSFKQKVKMRCNKHPQYQTAITLAGLKKQHFCPYCALESGHTRGQKIPYDIVKQDFEAVGYELLTPEEEYKNCLQKLTFICPKHGKQQMKYGHLREGKRCRLCRLEEQSERQKLSVEKVDYELNRRGFIWLDKQYQGADVPLKLSCVKHNDKVFYISYSHIVHAKTKCPFCNSISRGEKEIYRILQEHGIDFVYQQRMKDLYRYKGQYLSYDFYIPSQNLLIEYQGEYHKKVTSFNTEEHLADQQERDKMKREYAKAKGYKLLEIWYKDLNKIEAILLREGVIKNADPISVTDTTFSNDARCHSL